MVNFETMSLKSQIPNLLTLSNLLFGVISVFFAATNRPETAAWLILGAIGFDFLDGLAARVLNVSGELGKQLDSLADVISFGVAPVFLALQFNGVFSTQVTFNHKALVLFAPIVMAAFSAYRLGKFNIDERQKTGFIGLPTPANALFWVSLALAGKMGILHLESFESAIIDFRESTGLIVFASLLLGLLMVSEISLIALKFKDRQFRGNESKWALIALSIILFLLFGFSSVPILLLLYLIISLISTKSHAIHRGN